ncbi:MAG: hypothetical protein IBJ11_05495, partial [Phycisphaerales bacterium]|nr:hypothetical protein [Phycisphaerales bacterium]
MLKGSVRLWLWWLSAMACAPAWGQGAIDLARFAPPDASVFVAAERGAEIRRGRVGELVQAVVEQAAGLGATREAWSRLAAGLGWSEEQAFDELLGRRIVFVSRGAGEWAIVGEVSPGAAERLRRTLQPAPRGVEEGRPVLAVEAGAFELVVVGPLGEGTVVVLAPGESAGLRREMAAAARGDPVPSLAATADFDELRATIGQQAPGALVYWRGGAVERPGAAAVGAAGG